jgi:hypothetical protein
VAGGHCGPVAWWRAREEDTERELKVEQILRDLEDIMIQIDEQGGRQPCEWKYLRPMPAKSR